MSLDPRARLGLLVCVGVAAVCLDSALALGALAVACAAPLALARVPGVWWRRGLVVAAAVVWGTMLSQGLFYAGHPRVAVASLGPLHLYREGLLYGAAQSLRLVALAVAGLSLTATTPPDRVMAALLAVRVPFGLALMGSTALRFLPDIGRELIVVRTARAARGRPVWRRAPWAWLALEIALLRPVLARSWRRAHAVAETLDARGFDPLAPRAVWRPLRWRAADSAALGVATAAAGALLGARLLMAAYTADALYIPALRPLYAFIRAWL